MIELRNQSLKVDPSQGSHFFQNITSLGIYYATVTEDSEDFFDWNQVKGFPLVQETGYLRHVHLETPILLKTDGRSSQCVMIAQRKGSNMNMGRCRKKTGSF